MPLFRPRSIEELKARGDVPGLVEAVVNPDHRQVPKTPSGAGVDAITARNTAIKALWALRTPEALAALISLLDQPDEHLRKTVVSPLEVGLVTTEAFDLLVRGARDPGGWVRSSSIREICNLDDERVVPLLLEFLDDQDPAIRLSTLSGIDSSISVTSLWGTQPPDKIADAVAHLAMRDPDDAVRQRAFDIAEKVQHAARTGKATPRKPIRTAPASPRPNIEQLSSKRHIEGLRAALRYEDVTDVAGSREVRRAAAAALGILASTAAVESLIDTLEDDDPKMRKEVIDALAKIGDPRAVAPITNALQDREDEVRARAAEALGQIGNEAAVRPLLETLRLGHPESGPKAAEALGRLRDDRAVEPLIAALRADDYRVRCSAAEALAEFHDDRAVEPLIAAIANPHIDDEARGSVGRARAVRALGRFHDPRALDPLLAALSERSYAIRAAAAAALGELGDIRALDDLIRAVGDDGASIRQAAIWALGNLGDARAVDAVIRGLRDVDEEDIQGSWGVRSHAVAALGMLGGEKAIDALVGALFGDVGYKALQTLKALGGIPSEKVRAIALIANPRVIGADEPLKILVSEQDWDDEFAERLFSRMVEVRALLEDDARTGSFNQEHYNAAPTVRQNYKSWMKAAEAYFGEGKADRLQGLEGKHQERVEARRKHLAELERQRREAEEERERQAVDPAFQTTALVDAARNADWKARDRATKNLVRLGSAAVPGLVETLSDPILEVRWSAADVLRRMGDPFAVEALAKLLDDEEEGVRDIAEQALQAIGGGEVARILENYNTRD